MVHILLDVPELTAPWLIPALKPYLTPERSVLVIDLARGALIAEDVQIRPLGDVHVFLP